MTPEIYLASRSPRRQALLKLIGVRFEALPADLEERAAPDQDPGEYALAMAVAKARMTAHRAPQPLPVLGADTDVVLDGEILGKPADRAAAVDMLLRLSGRSHEVYSAVAVEHNGHIETALTVTQVWFGRITRELAAAYWATGEPADKAGAYAIQGRGARFVREIQGSYTGVVGLPLYETAELLANFGVKVFPSPESRVPSPVG